MQAWYDSIPQNLQGGTKADEIQDCICQLQDLQANVESLDFSSVEFPGMMG